MSEPFIAEVRIFAGNFAPRGWAFCNGQLLPISQNTALFSLIGTTYGGDGRTTVGLPNLQGRAPMHPGRGPGLTQRRLGETGGAAQVTLTEQQMPQHTHQLRAVSEDGEENAPAGNYTAATEPNRRIYRTNLDGLTPMANEALQGAGDGQPHDNRQPSLVLNFIIALVGIYPSRG